MRANGVPESHITGDAPPRAKFDAWAACMPRLLGSPLAGKDALLTFYTHDHLMSAESRAAWAEPDRIPLDVSILLR